MCDAGAIEYLPLRIGNGALITNRQGNQHAKIRRIRQARQKTAADGLAQALHHVAGAPDKALHTLYSGARADGSGRPDIAL